MLLSSMFWIYFGQTWVFCQLDKITFAPLLGIDKCKLIFSFASLFASYSSYISVRAMQYVLDMALNTKIPDDLVHKLSFECFRNWLQYLECLWFNFKICGIFPQLSVLFTPCIHATILKFDHTDHSWSEYAAWYAADKDSRKQQHILQIVMNHQSNQIETCKSYEYWSANANFSELCHKGHKTKGQILLHLYGSLWTKSSGFLVFLIMSSTYCIARTLVSCNF